MIVCSYCCDVCLILIKARAFFRGACANSIDCVRLTLTSVIVCVVKIFKWVVLYFVILVLVLLLVFVSVVVFL